MVEDLGVGLHVVPLLDETNHVENLSHVMSGADGVFHLAGLFDPSPEGLSRMTNLHVFGTRALLRAAELAGVARFVHCSSSVTVGFSETLPNKDEVCENWAMDPNQIYGRTGALRHYYNTKIQSEELVLGWENLETLVVNPDYILGPLDV